MVKSMKTVWKQVERIVKDALAEDFASGDVTTEALISSDLKGRAASILKAERTALNFLQHMSGIATETARYVEAVSGTKAVITDTRKTMPGLRILEKYAVLAGGGKNHRVSLADGVLIKDNHLIALRASGVGLGEAVKKARRRAPKGLKIEVEVESVQQAQKALA